MSSKPVFTTPKGVAVYPRLGKPDTKFHDLGQYKADISIPAEEAKKFLEPILKLYKEHTGKNHPKNPSRDNKNAIYWVEEDEEGNETGNYVLKLRVKNKNTREGDVWDRKPAQFSASGKPIKVNPYGGTVMKVSIEAYAWKTPTGGKGLSLQPLAIQVFELVEGQGGSASNYGFAAEEGYEADDDNDGVEEEENDAYDEQS